MKYAKAVQRADYLSKLKECVYHVCWDACIDTYVLVTDDDYIRNDDDGLEEDSYNTLDGANPHGRRND